MERKRIDLDATGTEFEIVLKNIRTIFSSEMKDDFSRGGAIAFYSAKHENGKYHPQVQLFPLNKDIVENATFMADGSGGLKKIKDFFDFERYLTNKRPYQHIFHMKHFREKAHTLDHYFYRLKPDDFTKLPWCDEDSKKLKDSINDLKKLKNLNAFESHYNRRLKSCLKCRETFLSKLKLKNDSSWDTINSLDFFFFNGTPKYLWFIPLTFFSSPSILAVLGINEELEGFQKKKTEYIKQGLGIKRLLKSSIYHYVYRRLIMNLKTENKKTPAGSNFPNQFIEELNKTILPISYKIAERDTVKVIDWGEKVPRHSVEMNLRENNVTFTLPSFQSMIDKKLHDFEFYEVDKSSITKLIEDIYDLICSHYEAIKAEAYNKIQEDLDEVMTKHENCLFMSRKITTIYNKLNPLKLWENGWVDLEAIAKILHLHLFENNHSPEAHVNTDELSTILKRDDIKNYIADIKDYKKRHCNLDLFELWCPKHINEKITERNVFYSICFAKALESNHFPGYWLYKILSKSVYNDNFKEFMGDKFLYVEESFPDIFKLLIALDIVFRKELETYNAIDRTIHSESRNLEIIGRMKIDERGPEGLKKLFDSIKKNLISDVDDKGQTTKSFHVLNESNCVNFEVINGSVEDTLELKFDIKLSKIAPPGYIPSGR